MLIALYVIALLLAAYVRLWTESGVWHAVHTGRTFMLQAAAAALGIGLAHFEFAARSNILRPLIRLPIPADAEKALIPPLSHLLANPEHIFIVGVVFLLFYVCTGFPEQRFLEKVDNPPHPRKYVSYVDQVPTKKYKGFIVFNFWLGIVCLLGVGYFLVASEINDWKWYIQRVVIPAHVFLLSIFVIGYFIARHRGTSGKPQNWDQAAVQPIEKPKQ